MKKVYLICPVRNCNDETSKFLTEYVLKLEEKGYKVHYPPRDVNQDLSGFEICEAHKKAMLECDEVHFYWDPDSKGSHFDFGMAFMLLHFKSIKLIMVSQIEGTSHKSYGNVIKILSDINI